MSDVQHVRTPKSRCPHCGYLTDAVSTIAGRVPRPCPGDLSVCFGCGEALQFDRRLRLTTITAAELAALHPEEREKLTATQGHICAWLVEFETSERIMELRRLVEPGGWESERQRRREQNAP